MRAFMCLAVVVWKGECHASRSITVVTWRRDGGIHMSSSSCMEEGDVMHLEV